MASPPMCPKGCGKQHWNFVRCFEADEYNAEAGQRKARRDVRIPRASRGRERADNLDGYTRVGSTFSLAGMTAEKRARTVLEQRSAQTIRLPEEAA